jgi:hypothetical protein
MKLKTRIFLGGGKGLNLTCIYEGGVLGNGKNLYTGGRGVKKAPTLTNVI